MEIMIRFRNNIPFLRLSHVNRISKVGFHGDVIFKLLFVETIPKFLSQDFAFPGKSSTTCKSRGQ